MVEIIKSVRKFLELLHDNLDVVYYTKNINGSYKIDIFAIYFTRLS